MLEDGLVVPGTYTALSDSRGLLETLKTELDKKILTLKHMKLKTGNITTKMSFIVDLIFLLKLVL